ncbi:hypothetical protein R1sor_020099 [Riccia sorocarpa]|uniref:CCHC-type domain-containing protein n=1 Tax=Riccia sorocarpa TaxID=122646 RepID=A0ABD3IEK3_9MARC
MERWKESDPLRPIYRLRDTNSIEGKDKANWHGIPIIREPIRVDLPAEVRAQALQKTYRNKVVLSFQDKVGAEDAKRWIRDYSVKHNFELTFVQELANQLHLVAVEGENPRKATRKLVKEEYLELNGFFAAVNPYSPTFNAEDPEKIRQIITVIVYKADAFVYELAELILQTVGTVLSKELVDNERGSTKLRAVIATTIEEFPTTLEVPITADFTIYVQLDYEGLHLRCFKCGSLDHKAEDCEHAKKGKEQVGGRDKKVTIESSEETSNSTDQPNAKAPEVERSKAPQKSSLKITRSQSEEVLAGRKLWTGAPSRLNEGQISTGGTEVKSGAPGSGVEGRAITPATHIVYKPPAARSVHSGSTSKRKERSRSDSEEEVGHIRQMKIILLTYNVCGITKRAARTKLKLALQDSQLIPDVLALQEHKIREHKVEFYLRNVWKRGSIVANPATDGRHALGNPQVSAGKGGVALAFSERMTELITQSGRIGDRAVWAHVEGLKLGSIGFLAVYAPNTTTDRARLWDEIRMSIDSTRAWIFMGDFNMITERGDHVGGNYTEMSMQEKEAWELLVTELRLVDKFTRKPEENCFSWDNMHRKQREGSHTTQHSSESEDTRGRGNRDRILKRLDRIYVSEEISDKQQNYKILTSSSLSDHSPVTMELLDGEHATAAKARFCINASLLSNTAFKEEVIGIWKSIEEKDNQEGTLPEKTLRKCLRAVGKAMRKQGKAVAKLKRAKWEELRGRIKLYTLQLQQNPTSHEIQLKLQKEKDDLDRMEGERAKWIQQKINAKWHVNGDIPSKVFFELFKARQKLLEVDCLTDEAGEEVTDQNRMEEIAESHFRKLLSEETPDEDRLPDIRQILLHLRNRVPEADKVSLEAPMTEEELFEAAKDMKRGKSPRPDGTPAEFYTCMWETTGGLVTQSAFLPGRNIHTSVLTCNEAIHQEKRTGEDHILLQLDFKKAFDSVNWRFLLDTLQAYNFGVGFQNCIKAILSSAASSIILNGRRTKAVKVTRSVRQGCPLSPLLFILATQTLTEAMENEVESGRIQGIYLQKANLHYCLGLYADDSHVIIRATREGAMNTKRPLDTFGKATGLQIQWNKSAARWISTDEGERPQWAEDLGWCWKDKTETTQLLGFPFEEGINREELYQKCQRRISDASESVLFGKLSVYGRVSMANSMILGALWVASKVVFQRTRDGGLGLVSLTQQYLAFVARTMRWAVQKGKHPLKSIIQGAVEDENMEAFGVPGVQWMQTQDWEVRPLWGTTNASKDGKVRKADSRARRLLWEVGYRRLGDMTTTDGKALAHWEQRKIQGAEQGTVKLAFTKLTANLQGPQEITLKSDEKIRMFYETDEQPGVLWEWSTESGEKWRKRKPPRIEESGRTYEERNSHITPCKISIEPNEDSEFKAVAVITFRGGQGKVSRVRYADMAEEARDLATLCWDNRSHSLKLLIARSDTC